MSNKPLRSEHLNFFHLRSQVGEYKCLNCTCGLACSIDLTRTSIMPSPSKKALHTLALGVYGEVKTTLLQGMTAKKARLVSFYLETSS